MSIVSTPLSMLRKLAAVERAHALGDPDAVESILDGVDPYELRVWITALEHIEEPETAEPEPRPTPLSPRDAREPQGGSSVHSPQASGSAVTYPQVWFPNDHWSVKCR